MRVTKKLRKVNYEEEQLGDTKQPAKKLRVHIKVCIYLILKNKLVILILMNEKEYVMNAKINSQKIAPQL